MHLSNAERLAKIRAAIQELKTARDLLRQAEASSAAYYVSRALKSAESDGRLQQRAADHDAGMYAALKLANQ